LDNCYGQHGWKEFHRNRKDILAEFDKILEQTANRPIQVAHGQGVEAYLRKWLTEFLPKKYGVTSGYIIPNIYNDSGTIYHYDIIIYNQFDSPILWTEGNEDNSAQGKFRAIPAKHVVAVYEVKSRLTKPNASDAFNKLNQTKDFSDQLPPLYSCGVIFIELKESDNNKESIVKELLKGKDIFGFIGGMVLRYEGDDSCTALINIYDSESKEDDKNRLCKPLAKPIDQLNIYLTEDGNLQLAEAGGGAKLVATSENSLSVSKQYGVTYQEGNKSVHLSWARTNFADFCTNLLSALEGLPFSDKNRPSFGQIFDNIEKKKAPIQGETKEIGKPFINIKLTDSGESGKKLIINDNATEPTITFEVSVENNGDVAAIISDDSFKSECELNAGKAAVKPVSLKAMINDTDKSLTDILKEENIEMPYRLVYYPKGTDKDFIAIEKTIKITETDIEFL
tara:strand:- start:496 stop:1851 length:1356 start_codon:yes stop_codon:yes gene_type:complete